MDFLTLNIYGENDEIEKTYKTNHVRWKLFTDAVVKNEQIAKESAEQQIAAIGQFMKSVFIGITDEELEKADVFDVFNVFNTIVRKAQNMRGGNGKNA